MAMSDRDEFEGMFEEMLRVAGMLFEKASSGPGQAPGAAPAARDRDELVADKGRLSYVLEAPGLSLTDFRVSFGANVMDVVAPGVSVRRELPFEVDPASVRTTYANGLLAVRARKA